MQVLSVSCTLFVSFLLLMFCENRSVLAGGMLMLIVVISVWTILLRIVFMRYVQLENKNVK